MTEVTNPPGTTASTRRAAISPRALFMLPAGIALLAGLDAALLLLGVPAPVTANRLPDVHGMLMVLGFVGTLVAVERAVALRHPLGFTAPALLGLGSLVVLSPAPLVVGQTLMTLGTVAFVVVYLPLWRRQRDEAVLVQALGAVLAVGGATLWTGGVDMPFLVPWLAGFLVLTIAGERLELARIAMGASAGTRLVVLAAALMAGVMAALLWPRPGAFLLGATLLALTGWLAAHDVARHTIRTVGLTRYMAACMLAGYFWLTVAGGIWLIGGPAPDDSAQYDAVLHSVFLGFVISMIMAHAPVIFPAVLRRPLPYRPAFLGVFALLQLTLLLRIGVGDALGIHSAWIAGGVGNVVALLAFVLVAVWSSLRGAPGTA